eukprot:SAG31_NODE_558_length_14153_cov_9.068094_6_plen_159_part_00
MAASAAAAAPTYGPSATRGRATMNGTAKPYSRTQRCRRFGKGSHGCPDRTCSSWSSGAGSSAPRVMLGEHAACGTRCEHSVKWRYRRCWRRRRTIRAQRAPCLKSRGSCTIHLATCSAQWSCTRCRNASHERSPRRGVAGQRRCGWQALKGSGILVTA